MRKTSLVLCLLSLCLLLLAGCQGTRQAPESDRPLPLLLISIDGFRHDYFELAETPALDRLVDGGLKADSLHHVFPTKTFPTHYSLVTGCHPGRHGVVANSMWDPVRDARFSLGNRDAVSDGYWYDGCEPIWVTAENQGLTAATFFWPGSEARIHGVRPTHWKPYAGDTPHAERIETLLEWLDLPADQRPDLLTLYFSVVDSAGHRHGPLADPVRDALIDVDHHLGMLFDGLEERGLFNEMHIILVSDHGMSRVDFDQYIMLDDYL
ncbi:MAG: ectonucleotide pyrophosphatase/phosphodiesterase, partial [Wenzhouxiangella sp.]